MGGPANHHVRRLKTGLTGGFVAANEVFITPKKPSKYLAHRVQTRSPRWPNYNTVHRIPRALVAQLDTLALSHVRCAEVLLAFDNSLCPMPPLLAPPRHRPRWW
jgi:hypothetical protein